MSSTTATFYIVRHGQTEWNSIGRQQGRLDSPLTEKGVRQAHAAGRLLAGLLRPGSSFVVETSPLGRARQTAAIICVELGVTGPPTEEPLLAEHHLGLWQGLSHAEIEQQFPGAREARAKNKWSFQIPGGESYSLMSLRAQEWIDLDRGVPIRVAVTHEMMSRTIQGAYGRLSPSDTLARFHPHTSVLRMAGGEIKELQSV